MNSQYRYWVFRWDSNPPCSNQNTEQAPQHSSPSTPLCNARTRTTGNQYGTIAPCEPPGRWGPASVAFHLLWSLKALDSKTPTPICVTDQPPVLLYLCSVNPGGKPGRHLESLHLNQWTDWREMVTVTSWLPACPGLLNTLWPLFPSLTLFMVCYQAAHKWILFPFYLKLPSAIAFVSTQLSDWAGERDGSSGHVWKLL